MHIVEIAGGEPSWVPDCFTVDYIRVFVAVD